MYVILLVCKWTNGILGLHSNYVVIFPCSHVGIKLILSGWFDVIIHCVRRDV